MGMPMSNWRKPKKVRLTWKDMADRFVWYNRGYTDHDVAEELKRGWRERGWTPPVVDSPEGEMFWNLAV